MTTKRNQICRRHRRPVRTSLHWSQDDVRVRTVTLVTMQTMLTTSKNCVAVAKCERALRVRSHLATTRQTFNVVNIIFYVMRNVWLPM